MMKVVIFGAGLVGEALGHIISEQGHDVCFIESERNTVRRIQDQMDVQIIHGTAEKANILQEAGVPQADLILIVTNLDKSNIILTLIARSLNPTARIIARMKDTDFLDNHDLWQSSALSNTMVISPERSVIDKAVHIIEVQHAFDVVEFLEGRLRFAGFRLETGNLLTGKSLGQARQQFPSEKMLVVGVERGANVFIPTGESVLEEGDRIFLTIPQSTDMTTLLPLLGKSYFSRQKLVIAGGGPTGEGIALRLEEKGWAPVILESNFERCQELAESLKNSVLLHGDATDAHLLGRAITPETVLLSVTGLQEVNFFIAMMARKLGAMQVVAMMDNEAYFSMAPELGVDAILSPRTAAVGSILRFQRIGRVLDASVLLGGRLLLFLAEVESGSTLDGNMLKDVVFPRGVIVAAAVFNQEVVVPYGGLTLHSGDLAVFVTQRGMAHVVDELIACPH